MSTTLQILRQARELLSEESRWTQEAYARDVEGRVLYPNNPNATCFCAVGALRKVTGIESDMEPQVYDPLCELINTAEMRGCVSCIPDYNDAMSRTHAEVLDLFDRTIQRLEQGEQSCNSSLPTNSEG